jgi:preprotein translocase subunit SecE
MADKIKLSIAAVVVIAGVWGFYYLGGSPAIARIGVILAALAVAAAVGWTTGTGKRFYAYVQESIDEAKKVVWPSRKETVQSTGVVMAFVVVMALFLWMVDAALAWVVDLFIRGGA